MKYLITIMLALLFAMPAFAANDPETTFVSFMKMVKSGNLKKAINKHGIDERSDKSLVNIKMPGDLKLRNKKRKNKEKWKRSYHFGFN